jgi:hypothetical protein
MISFSSAKEAMNLAISVGSAEISTGVYLVTLDDLNELISSDEQAYSGSDFWIHTNDGFVKPVDEQEISEILGE